MGRETRVRMPRNQPKAGMGIAYGQRKEREDAEKSVQIRHGDSLWAEKKRAGWRKVSPKQAWGQPMDRETRVRMLVNQSKAGIRTAYGQRNESVDGEKSVQIRHGDSLWAEKRERGWRKVSPKLAQDSLWAEKTDKRSQKVSPKQT